MLTAEDEEAATTRPPPALRSDREESCLSILSALRCCSLASCFIFLPNCVFEIATGRGFVIVHIIPVWSSVGGRQGCFLQTLRRTRTKNELHIYFLFSTFKLFMQPFVVK